MEIVRELLEQELQFIDGFPEFFEHVRWKYKTCIATAMAEDLLRIVDRRMGLSGLFGNKIFTLGDVEHRSKPNPDLFLYAASQLGSRPESCVVIEDSPHGIEAAKRAGMRCIGLTTTYDRKTLSGADLIVASYSEIDLTGWQQDAPAPTSSHQPLSPPARDEPAPPSSALSPAQPGEHPRTSERR